MPARSAPLILPPGPRIVTFPEAIRILELHPGAGKKDVREAFRRLAAKNHPDKYQTEEWKTKAAEKFRLLRDAYDYLNALKPVAGVNSGQNEAQGEREIFIPPLSAGEGAYWSNVTTMQQKLLKFALTCLILYVLLWASYLIWFSGRRG